MNTRTNGSAWGKASTLAALTPVAYALLQVGAIASAQEVPPTATRATASETPRREDPPESPQPADPTPTEGGVAHPSNAPPQRQDTAEARSIPTVQPDNAPVPHASTARPESCTGQQAPEPVQAIHAAQEPDPDATTNSSLAAPATATVPAPIPSTSGNPTPAEPRAIADQSAGSDEAETSNERTVWIGIDRMYGLHAHRARIVNGDNQMDTDGTHVNLAGAGSSFTSLEGMPLQQTASIPRLSFDATLFARLTAGLSVGYAVTNNRAEIETATDSISTNTPSQNSLLLALRVGYVQSLLPWLDLWLRVGAGASQQRALQPAPSGDRTWTLRTVNLSFEPELIAKVLPHVGLVLQAFAEGSVAAGLEQEDRQGVQALDYGETSFGLTTGLVVWL